MTEELSPKDMPIVKPLLSIASLFERLVAEVAACVACVETNITNRNSTCRSVDLCAPFTPLAAPALTAGDVNPTHLPIPTETILTLAMVDVEITRNGCPQVIDAIHMAITVEHTQIVQVTSSGGYLIALCNQDKWISPRQALP